MPLFFRSVKPTKENHIVCKHQCRRTFDEENQQAELREYYAQPRETQDTYLLRRIEICTANSRDRSNYKGKRQTAWKYHLFKDSRPVQVCQEFFLCSYGLTRAKLQTLRKRINANGNPTPKPYPSAFYHNQPGPYRSRQTSHRIIPMRREPLLPSNHQEEVFGPNTICT